MSEEKLLKATQYKWDSFEADIEDVGVFSYIVSGRTSSCLLRQWKFSNKKIKRYRRSFINNP